MSLDHGEFIIVEKHGDLLPFKAVNITQYRLWMIIPITVLLLFISASALFSLTWFFITLIISFIAFGISCARDWTELRQGVGQFWLRNIKGFETIAYEKEGKVCFRVVNRGEYRLAGLKGIGMGISLGWFGKPFIISQIFGGSNINDDLKVRATFNLEQDAYIVNITDSEGFCLRNINLLMALRTLEKMRQNVGYRLGTFSGYFEHLRGSFDLMSASQEDLWKRYCTSLSLIKETIRQIDGTKRFIKSTQARVIREWLLHEVVSSLPPGRPELYTMFEPLRSKAPVAGVKK
jgi:hypothetical protein